MDDDGALYCGRGRLGPTFFLVSLLTRPIQFATSDRLSRAAGHGHAVVLAPDGRMQENRVTYLPTPKLSGEFRTLLAEIVRLFELEPLVATPVYAPIDARVVLHRATLRVWIDALECVGLSETYFRLLECLIVHGGEAVYTWEVAKAIAGEKATEDTTRKTLESFAAAVDRCFKTKAEKRSAPRVQKLIRSPRRGYYELSVVGFIA